MELTAISVHRTIPAPVQKVLDAGMDRNSPGGPWFGAACLIRNPAVDGLFYLAMNHEGRTWPHYGRFLQVNRPRVVEYTWIPEATKGVESVVLVTFDGRGDQTEVTLRHSAIPGDAMGRQHEDGWAWVLALLAERFTEKGPETDPQ